MVGMIRHLNSIFAILVLLGFPQHSIGWLAAYYGYEPSSIDELLDVGFSTDEIEELLYERMIY